ncbi:MAG: hypothetical protein MI749_19565 [Desulfovibrionales bacterium]|nr:hypothetical protein [Desulfovibrionales bacterium]
MTHEIKQPTSVAKIFIIVLLTGFAVMLISSGVYRTQNPSLTKIRRASAPAQSMERPAGDMSTIANLMGEFQKNPNDVRTIRKIAQQFMKMKEFTKARDILTKGIAVAPKNGALYCQLGLANFQLKKYEDAVGAFTTAISLQDDPSAQYNLGILYKYYLDKPKEAEVQFAAIVNSTTAPANLKKTAQKERNG